MPELSPPPQPQQIATSCKGNARLLFFVATPFIFLLILSGCTGSIVPPSKAEESPPSSRLAQTESQVTTSESPDNELAAAPTAEATALFKQTLLLKAEEEFPNALEADPNHIPALTGISTLYRHSPVRRQEAPSYAEQAYNLAPEDASVLAHLTWDLQSAHRYEDADRAAALAMTADPESAPGPYGPSQCSFKSV